MRLAPCRVAELWLWQLAALQCSRKAPVNPALPWKTTATPAILALAQVRFQPASKQATLRYFSSERRAIMSSYNTHDDDDADDPFTMETRNDSLAMLLPREDNDVRLACTLPI